MTPLEPPMIASPQQTGMILDVAAVGIYDPAGADTLYLRSTNGVRYQLPEQLRDWATTVIGGNLHAVAAGRPSAFPCRIEFGILDGHMYAEML
ncbi:hypothetical protein ACQP1O_22150 [Nocardia sp. CA-151230]|uniref:hypothetical protein n=1 Tax=Nocardia sp. CA-151230 TaxID=3239982 RepID=UPI003D8A9A99